MAHGVDRCVLILGALGSVACTAPIYSGGDGEVLGADGASPGDAGALHAEGGAAPEASFDPSDAGTGGAEPGGADGAAGAGDAAAGVRPDAAAPQQDAGSPAVTPLPAWANHLLGRYYKRSISLGFDPTINMPVVGTELSLMTNTLDPVTQEIVMKVELCSLAIQWWNGGARLTLNSPQSVPAANLRAILGQPNHFSTGTAVQAAGFDPARQVGCGKNGVSRLQKFEDQKWITGTTCSCSTTPEILPISSSDCRLTDPDGDRQPGVGMTGTELAFDTSVAINTSFKIIDGEIRADGEHVFKEQTTRDAACVDPGCVTLGVPSRCVDLTAVRKLDDSATCATVLAYNLPVGDLPECRAPSAP